MGKKALLGRIETVVVLVLLEIRLGNRNLRVNIVHHFYPSFVYKVPKFGFQVETTIFEEFLQFLKTFDEVKLVQNIKFGFCQASSELRVVSFEWTYFAVNIDRNNV